MTAYTPYGLELLLSTSGNTSLRWSITIMGDERRTMTFVYCAFEAQDGEEVVHVCTTVECALAIPNTYDFQAMPLIEKPDQLIDKDEWAAEQSRLEDMRLTRKQAH